MAVLGNDRGISESEARKSVERRTEKEADMPGNDDDVVLLARVPDILSHRKRLRHIRVELLENSEVGRRYAHQVREVPSAGEKALLEGTDRIRRINLTDETEYEIECPKKTEAVLLQKA